MYFIWKAGSSLYYLILILIKLCKSDIHISVFLVIGILTSGASFIFEILFRNDFTGGGMGSFLLLSEVIFLCISFTYAVAKNKFKNIRFFEKVILTDAYKYYSLFICLACVPIVLIICLICCCKSYCDCGECSGRTYYASSEKETKQGKKKEKKKEKEEKPEKFWWEKEEEEREPFPAFIINGFAYDSKGRLWKF